MTYAEAMKRFGTDKPDLRFGVELVECTDVLRRHPVPGVPERVRRRGRHARRREPAAQAARRLAGVGQAARRPRPGLRAGAGGRHARRPGRQEPVRDRARRPGRARRRAARRLHLLRRRRHARRSRALLGAARLEIGRRCELIDESAWSFLWVVDAPLFEPAADAVAAGDVAVGAGAWTAVHHAFTSPKAEFLDTFDTDPGPALAYAYDMVCNGNEIGGGSIRIHRRDVQERVFKVMGLSAEDAQEKFGFLLDAFAVRRAAARRHRLRLGPHRHAARRLRLDPRRHRLPEVRRRLRPADRRPGADHAAAAQGGRHRQPAPATTDPWRRRGSRGRLRTSWCTCAGPATTPTGTTPSRSTSTRWLRSPGCAATTSCGSSGRPTGSPRRSTCRSAASSAPRTCCAPPTSRSPRCASPSGSPASGRSAAGSGRWSARRPTRVPAPVRRRGAAHPRLLRLHVGPGRAATASRSSAIGEKHRARPASVRVVAMITNISHRQRLRQGRRRVEARSTPTSSASTPKDDITLGDGYRWCTVVHPEPARAAWSASPCPGRRIAPELVEAIDAGPGRGRHARPRPERRRLPEDLRASSSAKGVEFLQPPSQRPYGTEAVLPRQLRATGSCSSSRASGFTADDFA